MPETKKRGGRKDRLALVAYCGLYCDLCAQRGRIPKHAAQLRDSMTVTGWDRYGKDLVPGFEKFWKTLGDFSDIAKSCPGCRLQRDGESSCGIRKCARKRKVEVCWYCAEWPCDRIEELAQRYIMLVPDGERAKRIGVGKWLKEQLVRAGTGFCYCDTRCPPDTKPRK